MLQSVKKTLDLLLQAAALAMLLIVFVSGTTSLVVSDLGMGDAFVRFFEPWSFAATYIFALALLIGFNVVRRKKSSSSQSKESAGK